MFNHSSRKYFCISLALLSILSFGSTITGIIVNRIRIVPDGTIRLTDAISGQTQEVYIDKVTIGWGGILLGDAKNRGYYKSFKSLKPTHCDGLCDITTAKISMLLYKASSIACCTSQFIALLAVAALFLSEFTVYLSGRRSFILKVVLLSQICSGILTWIAAMFATSAATILVIYAVLAQLPQGLDTNTSTLSKVRTPALLDDPEIEYPYYSRNSLLSIGYFLLKSSPFSATVVLLCVSFTFNFLTLAAVAFFKKAILGIEEPPSTSLVKG
jgi:hypothetical protein